MSTNPAAAAAAETGGIGAGLEVVADGASGKVAVVGVLDVAATDVGVTVDGTVEVVAAGR